MNTKYKCPYCGQSSYAPSTKKTGSFTNWKSVSRHLSKCKKNNNTYIVCEISGPISVKEIENTDIRILRKKYPSTRFRDKLKNTSLKKDLVNKYNKEDVIQAIIEYYKIKGKIPLYKDFDNPTNNYPTTPVVKKLFGSWNNAILAAGFSPNIQNGFGIDTYGLDGHLYRSRAEAYFADNYLYNKYNYIIEPKYPEPFNKYYDWYLKDVNIYIELGGGIRPLVVKEKIDINKLLNRKTLFIKVNNIYSDKFNLEEIILEMRASEVAGTAC